MCLSTWTELGWAAAIHTCPMRTPLKTRQAQQRGEVLTFTYNSKQQQVPTTFSPLIAFVRNVITFNSQWFPLPLEHYDVICLVFFTEALSIRE